MSACVSVHLRKGLPSAMLAPENRRTGARCPPRADHRPRAHPVGFHDQIASSTPSRQTRLDSSAAARRPSFPWHAGARLMADDWTPMPVAPVLPGPGRQRLDRLSVPRRAWWRTEGRAQWGRSARAVHRGGGGGAACGCGVGAAGAGGIASRRTTGPVVRQTPDFRFEASCVTVTPERTMMPACRHGPNGISPRGPNPRWYHRVARTAAYDPSWT